MTVRPDLSTIFTSLSNSKAYFVAATRPLAEAYLRFLYTEAAQDLAAQKHYRPRNPKVAARYAQTFPHMDLVTIANFGGWQKAQLKNFVDGGTFDQIYKPS